MSTDLLGLPADFGDACTDAKTLANLTRQILLVHVLHTATASAARAASS